MSQFGKEFDAAQRAYDNMMPEPDGPDVPESHVDRWLAGEISLGKLLELEHIPYSQGADLVGALWGEAMRAAEMADKELSRLANAERADELELTRLAMRLAYNDARLVLRKHFAPLNRVSAGA